jgi:hypothetical protein
MPQSVTLRSLPRAFELVKGMQAQGLEWGDGYRAFGRDAIGAILRRQMDQAIDEHLDRMAALDIADRRNGSYSRHLLTELGDIELAVPRTRRFTPRAVLRAYARRPEPVDRMILARFVLGLSTRKVGDALLRPVSPATVSAVAKQLDAVVATFDARPHEPGQWVSFPTARRWTASSSPSSIMKIATRASAPLSLLTKPSWRYRRGCRAATALDTCARISLVTCCGRAALVINAVLCDRSTRPIRRVVRGCDGSARAARFWPGRADQRRHARRNYPKPVAQRRDAWRGGLARPRLPNQRRARRGRPALRRGARRSEGVTRPSRRPAWAGDWRRRSGRSPAAVLHSSASAHRREHLSSMPITTAPTGCR